MEILKVSGVNKSFGGLRALNNVDFAVEQGTVHAIIGPNGAGKSTFLNCMIGRLIPDTGTVMFGDISLTGMKPYEINQVGVSRVFQTPEIFADLTLLENVLIPTMAKRDGQFALRAFKRLDQDTEIRDKALHMLEDVGLVEKKDMHSGSLSRGDKRRLELAMCLSQDPKLLLLDEPTASLDATNRETVLTLIEEAKARGAAIIGIFHDEPARNRVADREIDVSAFTPSHAA